MKEHHFTKYYCVFKNATAVTEVSVNDFKPSPFRNFKRGLPVPTANHMANGVSYFSYSLPPDEAMFYGYTSKIQALEKAKAGALSYINALTAQITQGILTLKAYRTDNYHDLNVTLLDKNIRKLEQEMQIK